MKPNPQDPLATFVDRELKALPPLTAPPSLAPRILAAIAARASLPWYRRAWQTWPVPLQAASFASLLAAFGTLCFGGGMVFQSPTVTATASKVGEAVSWFEFALRILGLVRDAVFQLVQQVNPLLLAGVGVMVLMAYALCLGLGSACLRFAYVRR